PPPELRDLRQMRIGKREPTADLVVGLVERAAGDEDANHRRRPLRDVRTRSTPPMSQATNTMAITISTTRNRSISSPFPQAALDRCDRQADDDDSHSTDDVVPEECHLGMSKRRPRDGTHAGEQTDERPVGGGARKSDSEDEDAENGPVEERSEPIHYLDQRSELHGPDCHDAGEQSPEEGDHFGDPEKVPVARLGADEALVEVDD